MEEQTLMEWVTSKLWGWVQVTVVLSGIFSIGIFIYIQAYDGRIKLQLPSVEQTCTFDESYSSPIKPKSVRNN